LHAIEKFGVTFSIEGASLVCDPGRGLAFFPLTTIDDQNFIVAVSLDPPHTDNA
jgi:hypothetical protein